ncbi:MAG TPA: hypothetical protein VIY51_04395, partial [Xanthobacteraceae bacterium]
MPTKKSRSAIAAEGVAGVFDDDCMRKLARISRLPVVADVARFAQGIRDAADIYARDARSPTVNELHYEIAALQKAATARRRQYDEIATRLEKLSPQARDVLNQRGTRRALRFELPESDTLRDSQRREDARATVARLCELGGAYVEGRKRPSGGRSRPTWRPLLHAPNLHRHVPKRDAERDFVMWLSAAWLEA